jgi:predicted phosphodiesterase
MKVAILSDVHGNLPALDRCLAEAKRRGCTDLVSLGDVFGYLPDGVHCFERLRRAGALMLLGNHEAMLLGRMPVAADREAVYRLAEARQSLSPEQLQLVEAQLPFMEASWGGRRLLLVHGTPSDPLQGYAYPDGDFGPMAALPYDYVVMGNTHRSLTRTEGSVRVVNVGSVGLPRDVGNVATFGIFDAEGDALELVRVSLDTDALREHYPDAHALVHRVWERR